MTALVNNIQRAVSKILRSLKLGLSLRQRAKFEGWFQVEFAAELRKRGWDVILEYSYRAKKGSNHRADLKVQKSGSRRLIMLKTVNTSFKGFKGVEDRGRPLTANINGVIGDIEKLAACKEATPGYALFPVFPLPSDRQLRKDKMQRYMERLGACGRLVRQGFVARGLNWGIAWYLMEPRKRR